MWMPHTIANRHTIFPWWWHSFWVTSSYDLKWTPMGPEKFGQDSMFPNPVHTRYLQRPGIIYPWKWQQASIVNSHWRSTLRNVELWPWVGAGVHSQEDQTWIYTLLLVCHGISSKFQTSLSHYNLYTKWSWYTASTQYCESKWTVSVNYLTQDLVQRYLVNGSWEKTHALGKGKP